MGGRKAKRPGSEEDRVGGGGVDDGFFDAIKVCDDLGDVGECGGLLAENALVEAFSRVDGVCGDVQVVDDEGLAL